MPSFNILNSQRRRQAVIEQIQRITIKEGFPIYCVEIKKYKKVRSLRQNALYWLWVEVLSENEPFAGWHKEDVHHFLKGELLGYDTRDILGRAVLIPISTTGLGVGKFTDYLNDVQAFAMRHKVTLPIPQDYSFVMGYDPETGEVKQ